MFYVNLFNFYNNYSFPISSEVSLLLGWFFAKYDSFNCASLFCFCVSSFV